MKKNIIKRALSLFMVLCTLAGMAIPAFAAENESVSVSTPFVKTDGNYYIVTGFAAIANEGPTPISSPYCLIEKNSLIKTTGSYGQSYKINMNGTRFISYSNVKKAPQPFKGKIYYTVKECPLRPQPYEGEKTVTLAKGTALLVVGSIVNNKGNKWMMVYYKDDIHYIFSKNVTAAKSVRLEVKGDSHTLDTRKTLQLTATVSPSAIKNVSWSSSNEKIATVNQNGRVTGVSAGNATITASIDEIANISWDLEVTRNVELDVKVYRQTKNNTCSAAAALAVLRYYGKETKTSDTILYKTINGNVGNITKELNKRLNNTYKYNTFKNHSAYENAIYNSLAQGSPVIARVKFKKDYFNYSTNGHYTTIIGMYKDCDGKTWLKLVDSFVDRYKSNTYSDKNTGIVRVPLETLYQYGTYGGTSSVYLIYNP